MSKQGTRANYAKINCNRTAACKTEEKINIQAGPKKCTHSLIVNIFGTK
jgi:hypothetical protein